MNSTAVPSEKYSLGGHWMDYRRPLQLNFRERQRRRQTGPRCLCLYLDPLVSHAGALKHRCDETHSGLEALVRIVGHSTATESFNNAPS